MVIYFVTFFAKSDFQFQISIWDLCYHLDRPYPYGIWKENETIHVLKISNDLVNFWVDSETVLLCGEFPQNSYIRDLQLMEYLRIACRK